MSLVDFPRYPLVHAPTPLEPLDRLRAALGVKQRLFIKRDDCTGLALGGNKARKLEFLIAQALAEGADTVVTVGALQSNHARMTAAAAARAGLRCGLVLERRLRDVPVDYEQSGNVLLDRLFGAEIVIAPSRDAQPDVLREYLNTLRARGARPFVIPSGGSTPTGALGYATAAIEIAEQLRAEAPDGFLIAHATGSGGTQAGLLAGLAHGDVPADVVGYCVGTPAAEQVSKVRELTLATLKLLAPDTQLAADAVQVDDGYIGPGYGLPTPQVLKAIDLLATLEGVLLDPVYTGKAMAGLIADLRAGRHSERDAIVFLHTGGAPGLFGYRWIFEPAALS